jgi:hypothetical protein
MIDPIENRCVFTKRSDSSLFHSGYDVNKCQMERISFLKFHDRTVGTFASYPGRRPAGFKF